MRRRQTPRQSPLDVDHTHHREKNQTPPFEPALAIWLPSAVETAHSAHGLLATPPRFLNTLSNLDTLEHHCITTSSFQEVLGADLGA